MVGDFPHEDFYGPRLITLRFSVTCPHCGISKGPDWYSEGDKSIMCDIYIGKRRCAEFKCSMCGAASMVIKREAQCVVCDYVVDCLSCNGFALLKII